MAATRPELASAAVWRDQLSSSGFSYVFFSVGLVLLIIALVTTSSHGDFRSMKLPASTTAHGFVTSGAINLTITDRGDFVVDGIWIPEPQFDRYISKRLGVGKAVPVSISVDRRSTYATVRAMAQRLAGLGMSKVFLVTDDRKAKLVSAAWSAEKK